MIRVIVCIPLFYFHWRISIPLINICRGPSVNTRAASESHIEFPKASRSTNADLFEEIYNKDMGSLYITIDKVLSFFTNVKYPNRKRENVNI